MRVSISPDVSAFTIQSPSPAPIIRIGKWSRRIDDFRVSLQERQMARHVGLSDVRIGFGVVFEQDDKFHGLSFGRSGFRATITSINAACSLAFR